MPRVSILRVPSLLVAFALVAFVGCADTPSTNDSVITKAADLSKHVGEEVVIRGTLERGKVPSVLGVYLSHNDVSSEDLYGKKVECTGKLVREVVEDSPPESQRPDGVYYVLVDASGDQPVKVTAVEKAG